MAGLGVQGVEIKREWRIHDSDAHKFRPDQVHSGPGELQVACEHAGECLPGTLVRPRSFTGQHEDGVDTRCGTLRPRYALSLEIVALSVVSQREIAVAAIRPPQAGPGK